MSSFELMLELLQRRMDEASESLSQLELPSRVYESVAAQVNEVIDAITAHGTLTNAPHLPIPSQSRAAAAAAAARQLPAVPPTYWERLSLRLRGRPVLYCFIGGTSATVLLTTLAANLSPRFRHSLFDFAPLLRSVIYVRHGGLHGARGQRRHRGLPAPPRPRVSQKTGERLEAVLILGADATLYARDIVTSFVNKGFVVIASAGSAAAAADLEALGDERGYVKAILLHAGKTTSVAGFMQQLNTALSRRYPLNSPGEPFSSTLELVSFINLFPLSTSSSSSSAPSSATSAPLPTEAWSSADFGSLGEHYTASLVVPLQILSASVLQAFRTSRRLHDVPATVITCLPGPERLLGTPFSGARGAAGKSATANATAAEMDILRRELHSVHLVNRGSRDIRVVNVDVGFLAPPPSPPAASGPSPGLGPDAQPAAAAHATSADILPRHIRDVYGSALLAGLGWGKRPSPARTASARSAPPHTDLSDKLLQLVVSERGSAIPDRTSVGSGVTTYYLASLLPTYVVDCFFGLRNRLLLASSGRGSDQVATASAGPQRTRKPLPLPGEQSSEDEAAPSVQMDQSATRLPRYAPSAPADSEDEGVAAAADPHTGSASVLSSAPTSELHSPTAWSEGPSGSERTPGGMASSASAFSANLSGYDSETGESLSGFTSRSTNLGDSYVQI